MLKSILNCSDLSGAQICYFKHSQIDRKKWDDCIENAYNSIIYAQSWYLDIVSPNWEALVLNDYQTVMPLPKKKKYGLSYLTQPFFTQQLGIFSRNIIENELVEKFVSKIPYHIYRINFNEENFCKKATALPNYVLDLQQNYEDIRKNFAENTKRNIKKAEKLGLSVKNINSVDFFQFFKEINDVKYEKLLPVLEKIVFCKNSAVKLYSVVNQEGRVVAANLTLQTGNRIINLVPVSNSEGREQSAMFFLLDYLIRQNAETEAIFDFEGSKIESIAKFYQGFGARFEPYYQIRNYFKY